MKEKNKNWWEKNWFKIIIAIAILIVAISAGYYFIALPKQPNQINNTDSQSVCATQAKTVFETFKPLAGIDTYSYKNHYNSNGTCYVLVHGLGEGGQEDALLNASENIGIAQCDSYTNASLINFCEYNGVYGYGTFSGSTEKYDINKFNNFVKTYMEN